MANPQFLNVDLEIESKSSLAPLAEELGEVVLVLYSGPMKNGYLLSIETLRKHKSPDKAIHALCSIVEQLSAKGKQMWVSSRRKEFDSGFDVPVAERCFRFPLRNDTLRRVADLGATLAVTIYHPENYNKKTSKKP